MQENRLAYALNVGGAGVSVCVGVVQKAARHVGDGFFLRKSKTVHSFLHFRGLML